MLICFLTKARGKRADHSLWLFAWYQNGHLSLHGSFFALFASLTTDSVNLTLTVCSPKAN